jgi:two-component system sensor histidine kinase ChvG
MPTVRAGRRGKMALNQDRGLSWRNRAAFVARLARARLSEAWNRAADALHTVNRALEWARALVWARIGPWVVSQPLWRFCTRSIGHRIFTANLVGFLILFVGLMFVSQTNRGLIEAKLESLETQGRMAAVAIAATLRNSDAAAVGFDLANSDTGAGQTGSALAAMELTIAPERVAPVVSRLISDGETRVRVYGRDGILVYDSTMRIARGQLSRPANRSDAPATETSGERLRTFWTRLTAWLVRSELPVYRDVTSPQGTVYPEVAEALRGHLTRMMLLNNRSEQIVSVAAPIQSGGNVVGVALLSSKPGDIDEIIWRQRRAILVLLAVALAATLFASWLLRRTIAGPMQRLSAAAGAVTHSINARQELPNFPGRTDEVAEMALAFRDMTDALYRRIEASDRFAQDVAHELKNPVAAARSTAESLAFAKTEAQRAELVRQIQGEMKRLNRLITDVAKASRLDAELALQETEPLDIADLVSNVAALMSDVHRGEGVQIRFEKAADPRPHAFFVRGHDGRLAQVLTNLIDNAVSFSPKDGEVRVHVERIGAGIRITIDDMGPGIPADKLEDIFKRFYSDRPQSDRIVGKNSGLGLSISREIVLAHGGRLHAENRAAAPGETVGKGGRAELEERRMPGTAGARFVIVLPAMAV